MLVAAFLGMGLGVALGKRRPGLVHAALPLLAILVLVLSFSANLGIQHLAFPDHSISLWGADWDSGQLAQFAGSLGIVLGLFWLIVPVFVCAGAAVGALFGRLPVLRAYSLDLLGSLAGVLAVAVVTWLNTEPQIWFLIGCIPLVFLSRHAVSWVSAAAVLILTWLSVDGAVFSPYNRIDLSTYPSGASTVFDVSVNRDFHQTMLDLSDEAIRDPLLTAEERRNTEDLRLVYDMPFVYNRNRGRALIVGAGTGNDVEAALRNGYGEVFCIDIDPQIVRLGRKHHPERPYDDRRARPVINDARAFFEQYDGAPFEVVCYGLLDSHAMFSALSTLRLENYVYTVEGLRAAWRNVAPNGHLSVNFSVFAGDWIANRMYYTLREATGRDPIMVAHGMISGNTFIVPRNPGDLDMERIRMLPIGQPTAPRTAVRVTSDNWPFLYVRPGVFPWGYVSLMVMILITASLAVRAAFGRSLTRRGFDGPLFFMGAAFLLLETRGVTNLSLLFGSTWTVNTSVFSGILAMALAANLLVARLRPADPRPWFIPLLISVAVMFFVNFGYFNEFPLFQRAVFGGILNALPVGFAGVVVSILLARSRDPVASLGSNLLGAIVGGSLEYLSMWIGLKALVVLIFVLYLAAFLMMEKGRPGAAPAAA